MNIAQHIESGELLCPDRAAIIYEGVPVTYRQLNRSVNRIANGLLRLGIAKADRVCLVLPNQPELIYAYLATIKLGAIAVFLNPSLTAAEMGALLDDCAPIIIFTTSELSEKTRTAGQGALQRHILVESETATRREQDTTLPELTSSSSADFTAVDLAPDSPAVIVYTSGTTGIPKGVVLSHSNVVTNMQAKKKLLNIQGDDRLLLFLPLFHCFGQNAILNAGLISGATVVLHNKFDPERVLASIQNDGVTMFFGVPANYTILIDKASPETFKDVRYYFSAAASLPGEIEERWRRRFGIPIHQGYGLTETSPFACYNHHREYRPGSIGTPIEGVRMKVVDSDNGANLGPGQSGQIMVSGPNVMVGYWNRPVETDEVIKDGWLLTGDIGRMDQEGYFYIEGRLKEMINVGGMKVYPAEVENVLLRHGAIAEAAVYGAANAVLGEQVGAAVVLKHGSEADDRELLTFCRERLAAYKVPSTVAFVDSLPKNSTGKLMRSVLRESLALPREPLPPSESGSRKGGDTNGEPSSANHAPESIRSWVEGWMKENANTVPEELNAESSFADYGLTSISLVTLAEYLSDRLGRRLDPTLAWNFSTVNSLTEHLIGEFSKAAAGPGDEAANQTANSDLERRGMAAGALSSLTEHEIAALLRAELVAQRERRAK